MTCKPKKPRGQWSSEKMWGDAQNLAEKRSNDSDVAASEGDDGQPIPAPSTVNDPNEKRQKPPVR